MGLFRRRAQVSTAAQQIYMVAGSYWCPVLRAGGFRIDPRALGPSPATMADAASKPGAAALPLFPGERPPTHCVQEWLKNARPVLLADQSALVAKTTPHSLLSYRVAPMPDALIADTVTGVTPAVAAARAATRLAIEDSNALNIEQRASHLSKMLHTIYKQIIAAVRPKAPLLYDKLERTCKQGAPFALFHDGCIAWGTTEAMSLIGAMLPDERADHDAALFALQLNPLPNGSSPDEFLRQRTAQTHCLHLSLAQVA